MNDQASREDQFVAALCHASLLMPLAGMAVPLLVWFGRRKESPLLRFQAMQALAYQVVGLLVQFALYGCQMATTFGFMFAMVGGLFLVGGPSPSGELPSGAGILGVGFIVAMVLMMLLFPVAQCGGGLVYVVLGLWGALQMIRGRAFYYPVIGKWIDRRLGPPEPVPMVSQTSP